MPKRGDPPIGRPTHEERLATPQRPPPTEHQGSSDNGKTEVQDGNSSRAVGGITGSIKIEVDLPDNARRSTMDRTV